MSNPLPKAIVLSAPSGAGKTTVLTRVRQLLPQLAFSVSATTRQPRPGEVNGTHYFFLTHDDFRQKIEDGAFLEWEEVYAGTLYGTLRSEIHRIHDLERIPLLELDVKGGLNVKQAFGSSILAVFLSPPSMQALTERLTSRGTETPESLRLRLEKAEEELEAAPRFDHVVVNDDVERAAQEVAAHIRNFLAV